MKLTNKALLNSISNLRVLSKKQLPVKVSYAIAKNISKIEKELTIYEIERQKLIDKYAKKDNEGKVVADNNGQIKFKDKENWEKDINELLDIEVEIEFHKFNIKHLEGREISPAELIALEHMIEE